MRKKQILIHMTPFQLECCGDDAGPKSWYKSTFNDYDFQGEELGQATTTNKDYYDIPDSCCR